jgi:type IV pilus assembly protein PilA
MQTKKIRLSNEQGFSLMELLIVIAIIGILAAVIVPNLMGTTRSANQAAAIATLKTIMTEQAKYATSHKGEYATFDQLVKAGALNEKFAGEEPVVQGYIFRLKVTPRSKGQVPTYTLNADPEQPTGLNRTGDQFYYTDPAVGNIRVSEEGPAKASDPSL